MSKVLELKIKDSSKIYQELAKALSPYREEPVGSLIFVVEGTKKKPIIGLRYPGKKLRKRVLKTIRKNSIEWANLFDFEVIPFEDGRKIETRKFTFETFLRDFQEYKRDSKEFWELIGELYEKNTVSRKPPSLGGIDSELYLRVLKWVWIQEDFNYRFKWQEVNSPIPYVLETRTGTRTGGGAGRAKFFAALILLKNHFNFEQVKKIIPLY